MNMTEAIWLQTANVGRMLDHISGKASPRQLRLFAAACMRGIWDLLRDEPHQQAAIMALERFAETWVSPEELHAVRGIIWPRWAIGIRCSINIRSSSGMRRRFQRCRRCMRRRLKKVR